MADDKLTWVELRKAVAQNANVSEQEAGQFLNALLGAVTDGLKTDKQVKIKGIGTFALKAVAPRKSVNIATGETFIIDGYNKLTFNAEATLKESVEKRIEPTKTDKIMADINPDPMRKLGEQADEIVDLLADLGQAPTTVTDEEKVTEEVIEKVIEDPATEEVIEEVAEEPAEATVEEVAEENFEDTNACLYGPPLPEEKSNKPKCKCHKWVCWVVLLVILLGLIGVGFAYRTQICEWWQCVRDCQNDTEVVVVEEVVEEPTVIPLAQQPREYVNFIGVENVAQDSRLAWIAYKYYGQKDLWVFIYEANRELIDYPRLVHPNQKLRIPDLDEKYRDLSNPELRQLVDSLANEYLNK